MVGTDKKSFKERDIRNVIYEAGDHVIEIWAPQLRQNPSFWIVGTSMRSRVKINALCPDTCIRTDNTVKISGTSSEYWEKIETIGTAMIEICDQFPIQVHVTRSRNVAPFMADGILGMDILKKSGWDFDKQRGRLYFPDSSSVQTIPGPLAIPGYVEKLRDHQEDAALSRKEGNWRVISERTKQLREHLPAKVIFDERSQIVDILEDYSDCLYIPLLDKLGVSKSVEYAIKTDRDDPIYVEQPKYSNEYWDSIETITSDLLRQGVVKGNSTSPYNFIVHLEDKKMDSRGLIGKRLVVEYAKLNAISTVEKYPIPVIKDAVNQLYNSRYFSVLDLASACYQIPLRPEDRKKTAFTTRSGRYEFQRMPVRIRNGSEYEQLLMNKLFASMKKFVFVCHDDILVHTGTIEEHEVAIRQVMSRLRDEGLKLQPGKCQLFSTTVKYLGYELTNKTWSPTAETIKRMFCRNPPATLTELKTFLSLATTNSHFIRNFAGRAKPIWDVVNSDDDYWTDEPSANLKSLQKDIANGLSLYYPNENRSFTATMGATRNGIYAVLEQANPSDPDRPFCIECASRTYKPSEKRYSDSAKELLAIEYGRDTYPQAQQYFIVKS